MQERWQNVALYAREWATHSGLAWLARCLNPRVRYLDEPTQKLFSEDYELAKLHPSLPTIAEMMSEAALFFVNSDPVLEWPGRPTLPNVVYVGGQQAEYPKPLFHVSSSSSLAGYSLIQLLL